MLFGQGSQGHLGCERPIGYNSDPKHCGPWYSDQQRCGYMQSGCGKENLFCPETLTALR
jgi:hypothetical protein